MLTILYILYAAQDNNSSFSAAQVFQKLDTHAAIKLRTTSSFSCLKFLCRQAEKMGHAAASLTAAKNMSES